MLARPMQFLVQGAHPWRFDLVPLLTLLSIHMKASQWVLVWGCMALSGVQAAQEQAEGHSEVQRGWDFREARSLFGLLSAAIVGEPCGVATRAGPVLAMRSYEIQENLACLRLSMQVSALSMAVGVGGGGILVPIFK